MVHYGRSTDGSESPLLSPLWFKYMSFPQLLAAGALTCPQARLMWRCLLLFPRSSLFSPVLPNLFHCPRSTHTLLEGMPMRAAASTNDRSLNINMRYVKMEYFFYFIFMRWWHDFSYKFGWCTAVGRWLLMEEWPPIWAYNYKNKKIAPDHGPAAPMLQPIDFQDMRNLFHHLYCLKLSWATVGSS